MVDEFPRPSFNSGSRESCDTSSRISLRRGLKLTFQSGDRRSANFKEISIGPVVSWKRAVLAFASWASDAVCQMYVSVRADVNHPVVYQGASKSREQVGETLPS